MNQGEIPLEWHNKFKNDHLIKDDPNEVLKTKMKAESLLREFEVLSSEIELKR